MGKCSEWVTINRGVPQGSVLGPLLFNIFVNDLFYTDIDSMICNYADDNHLVNENNCIDTLKHSLKKDAHRAITWFDIIKPRNCTMSVFFEWIFFICKSW